MRKIKLLVLILSLCFVGKSYAQEKIKESRDFKFFNSSYDQEDFVLKKVNDTLKVYIGEEKKLMYLWTNIGEDENFPEFEKNIDSFFELVNQIGLDFKVNNYNIRFSPETAQLTYENGGSTKYKKIGDTAIPIHRHTVRFTNRKGLTDIEIYLGEIDELHILKEAGITDIVRNMLLDNGWFGRYNNRLFNKDLKIGDNGEKEIVSYHNLEGIERLEFNADFGPRFLGSYFPIAIDISMLLDLGKYRKRSGVSDGLELSYTGYSFLSKDEISGFGYKYDHFINLGYRTNLLGSDWTIKYGRSLGTKNSFFEDYKNRIAIDFHFHPKFKITLESIFKNFKEDEVGSVGISYKFF
ncbi:hypothetical protein ACFSKL_05290 [Belliella marina]|uniref:DUF3187 family protein n=1 Tax=Belliella marina TaxID=1644146 RepID=A0ABW4VHN2_9BACT